MTNYCFGCKSLYSVHIEDERFGCYFCKILPGWITGMIGEQMHPTRLVCEPPEQVCDGKWVYEVAQ